ncbi:sensor histidine kinase [Lysinibacillus sp. 3P01SB]|uniref:sensor histidine kinase n=1 Tax=Lysinibacillus sp. 3P01SB TaxID=3132284 RepID=UPI0039A4CFFE
MSTLELLKKYWFSLSLFTYLVFGLYILTAAYTFIQGQGATGQSSYFFYLHFVLPSVYFLLTLCSAFYLVRFKGNQLLPMLILFLLTVSLAYISSAGASSGDSFSYLLFSTAMMLCISILVHFLRNYFDRIAVKWPYTSSLLFMYSFPIIIFSASFMTIFWPRFEALVDWMTLLLFSIGVLTIFRILLYGYAQSKKVQIRILIFSCIVPFLPYVFLYVLPELIIEKPFVAPEIAAIFFLLLPFSFIFTQLTERLFGLQYHLSRLRYYGSISTVSALVFCGGLAVFLYDVLTTRQFLLLFLAAVICIYILLVIKEKLDFRQRKLLPMTDSGTGQHLYEVLKKMGFARSEEELVRIIVEEIKRKLDFQAVTVRTVPHDQITLRPFEVTKRGGCYELLLHRYTTKQLLLVIGAEKESIQLRNEEMIWLELMTMYSDAFFSSLKRMEELMEEASREIGDIPWVNRLVWQFVEQEKAVLAQELHDTVLQEQLYLARELDMPAALIDAAKVSHIREQLLDISYELREYCEMLNPPLLDTLGLQSALTKFCGKVKLRADFILKEQFHIEKVQNPAYALMIYRIVQELLNNAMKHAHASHVFLTVTVQSRHIEILYEDDGVGLNESDFTASDKMGMKGMHERVRAFNGTMQIDEGQKNGLGITIHIEKGNE